jgi:hypothetical protein
MSKVEDKIANALQRVPPADAWLMMKNNGAEDITLIQHYVNYAIKRSLEERPGEYTTAEMYSYALVWTAGRALISGRRPRRKDIGK